MLFDNSVYYVIEKQSMMLKHNYDLQAFKLYFLMTYVIGFIIHKPSIPNIENSAEN